jgi:hypothetical protein
MQPPTSAIIWQPPPAAACQCLQTGTVHVAGVWQQLSWSDRLLSLWIIGAMGLGLILGKFTGALPAPRLRAGGCVRFVTGACKRHPHTSCHMRIHCQEPVAYTSLMLICCSSWMLLC